MNKITLPLLALAELMVATGAVAQSTDKVDASEIEEVTVTGSQIRGHENPGGQVLTLTSEDIKLQGLSTADDIFRSIPQAFGRGSMGAMDNNSQVPAGSVGHSQVDLGGFGAKSTLVLINGRRTASSSIMYGDSVNVSTIPVSAIERVEVLPTAAAAIYGADAVGGVVNIILKKRTQFEANTQVGYENSSNGGDASSLSQDLSFGWETGRFTGVASYRHSDPVTNKELGFTTQDFRNRGGYDLRSTTFAATGVITGLGTLPAGNDGTGFVPGDVSTANRVPTSSIAEYASPELKSTSAYINVEQDVGANVTLFLDAFYSKNDTDNYEIPLAVYSASVPASNAFNPYGTPVSVTYLFDTERDAGRIPSTYREADQELLQGTFGATITLPRDWRLQVYGTRANEESLHTYSWVSTADPAVIAALADSNPQTALNLFGNGTAQNQATLNRIVSFWMGQRHNKIESTLTAFALQADGELFELPSGAVKASFAAERRKDTLEWAGFGANQPEGDRTAESLGAEFAIPLMSAAGGSGQSLELTLAARWDRYNAEGDFNHDGTRDKMEEFSDTSPMVGLSWRPISNLRLRTSWNKAFRAPVVHDLAGASYDYDTQVFDPLAPGGAAQVPVHVSYAPSPDLGPEKAEIWTVGADWEWLDATGAGLKASLTYNNTEFTDRISGVYNYFSQDASFVVSHPELFGNAVLRDASGNLTNVLLRNINIAGQTSHAWNMNLTYGWRTGGGHFFTLGASGVYTDTFEEQVYDGGPVEELRGTYEGVDRLRATVRAGWASPEGNWTGNLSVHNSSSYTNTIQAYSINNPPAGIGSAVKEEVDGYTTVDLSGSYRYRGDSTLLEGVAVTAGVRNLFDEDFPFIDLVDGRTSPYDPRRIDVRGRVAFVELNKKF
ncbi:TonB-dependent receptor domain-containing protein [Peristeroidobacter soli]|uniref:TonB-dependent receptor domain-containing protein n=1 Tax=Peristeroidobacter soli TaxID=2497877 RepID=UPI00101BFA8A|nr:TonB-dependent receptor [Peristeroidobacter soli]